MHSALCNDEAYAAHDKAQYLGPKRGEYDKETEEYYEVHDQERAARTAHSDIQPASVRIRNYRHKTFGRKYEQAVEAVKAKEGDMEAKRNQQQELSGSGLGFGQVGDEVGQGLV